MNGRNLARTAALMALVALAACASKAKKAEQPAELVKFQSTATITRVWSASVGSSAPKLLLGLSLAAEGDALFAANHNGEVVALRQADGRRMWQTSTRLPLTGGPAAGEGLVVIGGSHGHVVALDAANGQIKWRSFINSELLSAPVVTKDVVVLRTVDGRIAALRTSDGVQAWSAEQQVPRLSLRGIARPIVAGELAISGFDNGRVMAVQLADGATAWDADVSPASGKTELERVNDVDTQVVAQGDSVYAVTFQGKAANIDLQTGQVQWTRDVSSYSGLALDDQNIYITTAEGSLVKLVARNGIEEWNSSVLARRRLSPPAVLGDLVAVGDYDGYVHFFDRRTGKLAGRIHALSKRVSAEPVVSGDTLYMLDAGGNIVALRAQYTAPVETPAAAPVETPAPAAAAPAAAPTAPEASAEDQPTPSRPE
jgi:outer membrane protein assembly factor BamB